MSLKRLFSVFAISIAVLSFTVFFGCVSADAPVSLYRPTAQYQTNLTVDEWIERGDVYYFKDDYNNAKECYFQALMADPSRIDVLNAYGVTLANTGFYENALVIFNIASQIDPYDEVVQYNALFCRQQIAMQTEQQRQLEIQQRQQQQENFNNLIASLNTLASSMQQQKSANVSQGSGNYSGGGQSSSSASSGSSSGGGGSNANIASMSRNYNSRAKSTEMALDNYRKAVSSGASKSETDRLYDAFINQQRGLKAYREECNRKGANIGASYYETVRP